MNSADLDRQPLIYADGYSYTEIFLAPDLPGMTSGYQLVRIFHTFSSDDCGDLREADVAPVPAPAAAKVSDEVA